MTDRVNAASREAWLTEIAKAISPRIEELSNVEMPAFRISTGFPSRGALSMKNRVIGQCFGQLHSKDGVTEMFISPLLHETGEVAATVAHELVHCNDKCEHGHKAPFKKLAYGIGLEGKATATVAGAAFKAFVDPILKQLGPYPHAGMVLNAKHRPQSTRMIKVMCADCGYVARTTRVWLDQFGGPLCPCNHEEMEVAS